VEGKAAKQQIFHVEIKNSIGSQHLIVLQKSIKFNIYKSNVRKLKSIKGKMWRDVRGVLGGWECRGVMR